MCYLTSFLTFQVADAGLCLVVPDKHTIKGTNVFLPHFYVNTNLLAQKLTKLKHFKENPSKDR